MSNLESACAFVESFCSGDLQALGDLLSVEFRFNGPFVDGADRNEYLRSLERSPARNASFELISSLEQGSEVCIFYQFTKPGVSSTMAQLFRFHDGKISETRLVFDSRDFD